MWPTQAGKIQKCIWCLANKSVFGVWPTKVYLLLGWGRCPRAMTDHLRSSHQHFFTWRHQHQHSRPTHFSQHSQLQPHHHHPPNCCCCMQTPFNTSSFASFTGSFNSEPEKNKSTQGVFLIPASPITSRFDHHTHRLNPTFKPAHWHQCWGGDLQGLRLRSDEPDHELVIGYNCPGLTALISQRAFRRLQLQLNLKWPTGQNLGTAKAQNWSPSVPGQAHKSEKAR